MMLFDIILLLILRALAGLSYWGSLVTRPFATRTRGRRVSREANPGNIQEDNPGRPALEVLYEDPKDGPGQDGVDIIAVHGLGANVDWSWVYKIDVKGRKNDAKGSKHETDSNSSKYVHWLKDSNMLPNVVPRSRIIAYNYGSRWHQDAARTRLQICGEELIRSVHEFRLRTPTRPIIFVGHSLGGNVIVNGFLFANSNDEYRYLTAAAVGFIFLGTPFRGTKWQSLADLIAQLLNSAGSDRGIIGDLKFDSHVLMDQLHNFCQLRNTLATPVVCFNEMYDTDYGERFGLRGFKGMVVEEASACIPGLDRQALQTDHLKINKYAGPTDRSFLAVSAKISAMSENAQAIMRRRENPNAIIVDREYALREKPEAYDCLRDLFLTDPREDRTSLKRKKGEPAERTCEWIFGTEELTAWLESGGAAGPGSILWFYGNPGTGKSTMSIFLTQELEQAFSKTHMKTLAYFFCDSAFDSRRTATSILRGLLLQIVQQHPQLLEYLLPKHKERGARLFVSDSFDALWAIFMAVAADTSTGRKYCVIDALDECDTESQKTLLWNFQNTFLSGTCTSNLRILVTSRPYPEIEEYLKDFTSKDLASYPEMKNDIDRCIEERVRELAKRKRYPSDLKSKISDLLRSKADGTFLWVGLACEELMTKPSKDAMGILKDMPNGLHALYKTLLDRATEQEESTTNEVRRILGFLCVFERPMSIFDLSKACRLYLGVEDDDTRERFVRDQIASCRLMVIIQDERVLLLHQSVKDYLLNPDSDYAIDPLKAHADLAYGCINILANKRLSGKHSRDNFRDYAIDLWTFHAHMAGSQFEVRKTEAKFFYARSPPRRKWLTELRERDESRIPHRYSVLHVAARWDLPAVVHFALSAESHESGHGAVSNVDVLDDDDHTALEEAMEWRHEKVVLALLERGATVTTRVLKSAARGEDSVRLVSLLFDRWEHLVPITWDVGAVATHNCDSLEVMTLLLNQQGGRMTVTKEALMVWLVNPATLRMMEALLDRLSERVTFSNEAVCFMAERSSGRVIRRLLERWGDRIKITEEVMQAAAENLDEKEEITALLLHHRRQQNSTTGVD